MSFQFLLVYFGSIFYLTLFIHIVDVGVLQYTLCLILALYLILLELHRPFSEGIELRDVGHDIPLLVACYARHVAFEVIGIDLD